MKKQQGFTLIELMIVVAIIAILAAIALPAYQNYVAKSQATAGLAEITPGKTAFEVAVNEGTAIANAADVGLAVSADTRCSAINVTAGATGNISCTLRGNPSVNTATIVWTRAAAGTWACTTTVADAKHRPGGCTLAGGGGG